MPKNKNDSAKGQKDKSNKIVRAIKVLALGFLLYAIPTVLAIISLLIFESTIGGRSGPQLGDDLEKSPLAQLIAAIIALPILFSWLYFILKSGREKWQAIGIKKPLLKHFGYAVLAYATILAIMYALRLTAGHFINFNQEADTGYSADLKGAGLVYAFITVVLIAPVMEEVVFRGYVFSRLRNFLKFIPSVILVSLLFGYLHLHNGKGGAIAWAAFTETFVASIVLCILREKTGNIWAGVCVHAVNNLVSLVTFFTFFRL